MDSTSSISFRTIANRGPLGTSDAGRSERVARAVRADALRCRAAAARLDGSNVDESDLRSLRAETRSLRDALAAERADRRAQIEELRAEFMDAIWYLREGVSQNGFAKNSC